MPQSVSLVTGGVKSGKSAYALQLGQTLGDRRAFIATATARDDEMTAKIKAHRIERGELWNTFEEPRDLAGAIGRASGQADVVLVDCLTLWISNLLTLYDLTESGIGNEIECLAEVIQRSVRPIIVVTNEVGLGIMPADRLSRMYQNLLGRANRRIADLAGSVYLMVSGIAVKIK